jgi:hypothetical protein
MSAMKNLGIGLGIVTAFFVGREIYLRVKVKKLTSRTASKTLPVLTTENSGKDEIVYKGDSERFPLAPGMIGDYVLQLQNALKDKFSLLFVHPSGHFDTNTLRGLHAVNYLDESDRTVSKSDFDNIINGVKK